QKETRFWQSRITFPQRLPEATLSSIAENRKLGVAQGGSQGHPAEGPQRLRPRGSSPACENSTLNFSIRCWKSNIQPYTVPIVWGKGDVDIGTGDAQVLFLGKPVSKADRPKGFAMDTTPLMGVVSLASLPQSLTMEKF
ncbi:MAG: hypothetical protein QXH80_00005, partial [Candidatus Nanoarchaeia archaeon]